MIPENCETYLGLDLSTQKVNRKTCVFCSLLLFNFFINIAIRFGNVYNRHSAIHTDTKTPYMNMKMQIHKIERNSEQARGRAEI